MSNRGRTIRLFLVSGDPTGLIIAEVGGWTGKVLVVPRTALVAFLRRAEAHKVAVYLLSGPDPEDPFRSLVYVGESETILDEGYESMMLMKTRTSSTAQ